MFTEETKALLKSAKETLAAFGGSTVETDPASAKALAEQTENRQMEGQTSLQKGDVVSIPADDEEFDSCIIARQFNPQQKGKSIGLLAVVKRGGKDVVIQIFSSAFTRGVRLIDAEGKHDDVLTYPKGAPAKDVRDEQGNMYQALSVLKGKTFKVVNVSNPETWTLKRNLNHPAPFAESEYEVRKQRVLEFAYEG